MWGPPDSLGINVPLTLECTQSKNTFCPADGRKGVSSTEPGLGLYSPIPSFVQPYLDRLTFFLFIGFSWMDCLPPPTVSGPEGHEHPVLPLQPMSQGDPAGWFNEIHHTEGRARGVMDLAVDLLVSIEKSWVKGHTA